MKQQEYNMINNLTKKIRKINLKIIIIIINSIYFNKNIILWKYDIKKSFFYLKSIFN